MDYLVFSSDGVLRVKGSDNKTSLSLIFIKQQSKFSELRFMSYWLNQNVIFEKGLTVGSFLSCLEPFEEYLNEYLAKDISSYIKESKKLNSIEKRVPFDWITLFHYATISEQNTTAKTSKENGLINKWKVFNSYLLCAYKNNNNEHFSIEQIPLEKIKHIPLYLEKESRVIINQKDIQAIDENKLLINSKAFGVTKQTIEGYDIEYLITEKEHTLSNVVEGFFKFFNENIKKRENEKDMLEDFNSELEDEFAEEGVRLKIHGGIFNQAVLEREEKNQYWNNLVKIASKEKELVKIGIIEEGALPEKKLFGQSIKEELKVLKIE